jgi:hypothetical protein
MSSDIVALPAINAETLKQRLDALVASTSSPLVLMPSDIIALPAADAEVLKQRLDALVTATEADEEKVVATTSLSYVDTIIANFHIQADTMMEEIHLDTSGPATAPTTFYSNKMSLAPLPPPCPPGKNNGSSPCNGNGNYNNQNRNNNHHNGGSGGKNSNTTVASHNTTTNSSQGPPPWLTYVNPSSRHIAMYPGPTPTGQQRSQAFMATMGPYTPPGFIPGQQQLY